MVREAAHVRFTEMQPCCRTMKHLNRHTEVFKHNDTGIDASLRFFSNQHTAHMKPVCNRLLRSLASFSICGKRRRRGQSYWMLCFNSKSLTWNPDDTWSKPGYWFIFHISTCGFSVCRPAFPQCVQSFTFCLSDSERSPPNSVTPNLGWIRASIMKLLEFWCSVSLPAWLYFTVL